MPDASLTAARPEREYAARLAARRNTADRWARVDRRITLGRRIVLFAVVGYVVFDPTTKAALVPLAVALVPLVFVQNGVLTIVRRAQRAVAFYDRGLARLENRWIGQGDDGRRYLTPRHLYAEDLDIFGRGSLFQLLCTVETPLARDTLAAWLSAPADIATVRSRQAAIARLRDDLDVRERLATIDADLRHVDHSAAVDWADAPPVIGSPEMRVVGAMLAWGLPVRIALAFAFGGAYWTLLGAWFVAQAAFFLIRRHRAAEVARHVDGAATALGAMFRLREALGEMLRADPQLGPRVAALPRGVGRASARMAECYGLLLQNSFLHALVVQALPFFELWRLRTRGGMARAVAAAGELETIAALSGYAYEHPTDPFPDLVETGPWIEAEGLRHPLMPAELCVPNDLCLGGERRLILISGSNMSGKSTLLRTLGTNVVLALAGARVRAEWMILSPVSLAAAMRFRDSVHDGSSYFHAVLTRLRAVLDAAGGWPPVVFLFDEILQGTNSQDRLIGAEAVMRRLLAAGAVGLMTTHDLALAQIVDDLAPQAVNMHCEDQVVDGHMRFDYKLRPGVVTRSNALELMRQMGLDV